MAQNQQLTGIIDFRLLSWRVADPEPPKTLCGCEKCDACPAVGGWRLASGFWNRQRQVASPSIPVQRIKRRERRERALAGAGGGAPGQSEGRCRVSELHTCRPQSATPSRA